MTQDNNQLLLELLKNKLSAKNWQEIKDKTFFYAGNLKLTDLSQIFQVPVKQIITFFWDKGIIVNQEQNLSPQLIENYCQSHGIKVVKQKNSSFDSIIEEYFHQINQQENLVSRPPVVSIMGHIDHGKTTLLDTIRGSQVQKEEKGGITQKISIYQVTFQEKKITFCDTPGHSDFIKMRQRGISLTDLVVLVIDAKNGIMSQTKEIINYLHEYQLPVIVFFNHKKPSETDNETNLTKLKSQVQEYGLTPIEWISGSVREKKDADQLCENILSISEIGQWKANPQLPACGLVIDSKLSSKLGKIALLLVQNGTLREKDLLLTNGKIGKIKRMTDFQKKNLNQAFPGDPVQVIGLDFLAEVGEKFLTISDDKLGKKISKLLTDYQKERSEIDLVSQSTTWLNPEVEKQKVINLLVIADTQASLEVLTDLVENKAINDLSFQIIASSVGNIPDQLLNLAKITRSYLLIFNLKLSKEIRQRFKENELKWFQSDIIYEVEEKLEKLIKRTKEKKQVEKILGTAEVTKIIYFSKVGNIAGCQVTDRIIERNNLVHVSRQGQKIFSGKIKSLQVEKEKTSEARKGQECGIVLEGFDDFQEKDQIISYRWEEEDVS
ncbi:translation initiation factor IF-2 [endosymbiont GvMRE of Glomus versiforme]|uniref:translation initiation factor IF-2 n=1 Tax=endosymbiont GvMRE of Glomus versiforme TaxID=2039283 RepID=UPI000EB82305|nr:translation initiation factor IF-2 [endosymbiont GvMRE of Glomus versiforme]RHZ36955.1 Translation initiation factor IF-2 [endosymbiont GvMRE of Glomus versiforme]